MVVSVVINECVSVKLGGMDLPCGAEAQREGKAMAAAALQASPATPAHLLGQEGLQYLCSKCPV